MHVAKTASSDSFNVVLTGRAHLNYPDYVLRFLDIDREFCSILFCNLCPNAAAVAVRSIRDRDY